MRLNAPIRELHFSDGQVMTLERDSIVVFVGPNNAGKTTCLRDIYSHLSGDPCQGLVASIDYEKPSASDVTSLLGEISVESKDGLGRHEGMGFRVSGYDLECYEKQLCYPKSIKEMLFRFLTTDARLSACNPEKSISREDAAIGPISQLIKDPSYLKKVSGAFKSAFALEVIPNYFVGGEVPLCLGATPTAPSDMSVSQISDYMYDLLSGYPLAHLQGDGMRSFLGVVLYLYIDRYSALFIDEPESFLHPPQAALMGSLIASNETADRQLFISTHSKDLLNGMLNSGASRVRVVRVVRTEAGNSFALLGSDDVASLSSTTLLKYSDLVNALFHERTILCESDSDCMFYQAIWDVVKDGESAPLFLPVGGKARFKVFADLLFKLDIDYTVVADADIIRDPGDFKDLLSRAGGGWDDVRDDWTDINNELGNDDGPNSMVLKAEINRILDACGDGKVSKNNCSKIRNLLESKSRWDELKFHGEGALRGVAFEAFKRIEKAFIACGVYVVPVGELECFVSSVSSHGPAWVAEVFQQHPDLSDDIYSAAREFVSSW